MLKYPVIFGIILVLLLLNAIPVLLFWDRTALANHSLLPIMFMGLNLLHGLTACLRKHKGNYLVLCKACRMPRKQSVCVKGRKGRSRSRKRGKRWGVGNDRRSIVPKTAKNLRRDVSPEFA